MKHDLQREYSLRFSETAKYRGAVWAILAHDFFQRWIPTASSVLDVGCGWGEFINQVAALRKYAMDLNRDVPEKLGPAVTLFAQDCSSRCPLEDAALDVVFTSHFVEQLPGKSSVMATLREAFRCLRPGGLMICMGPN